MRKDFCIFKYKSIWTTLYQLHSLRNVDNFLAPRLLLMQKHCSVRGNHETFAKPIVFSCSTLELKADHNMQTRLSRCSWQKNNWNLLCSSTGVLLPYLAWHQRFCISSYFQGIYWLGWRNSLFSECWHLKLCILSAYKQKHLHIWV